MINDWYNILYITIYIFSFYDKSITLLNSSLFFSSEINQKISIHRENYNGRNYVNASIKPSETNARDLSTNSDRRINAADNATIMKVINSSITD